MLKAYLDVGTKADDTDAVLCVACVIFKPTRYKQFVRPWSRMLNAWDASAFHATDFYNGCGEFRRDTPKRKQLFADHSMRFPRVLGERVERIFLVAFRPEEFSQLASPKWKQKFGTSVHSLAVQLCLIANGYWLEKKCPSERFAYFMESGDSDEREVLATVSRMRQDLEMGTAQVIRTASFAALGKGADRGLEAADFAAWHWNKYYMDKMRFGQAAKPRKDLAALTAIAKDRVEYIFATGAHLKYFFSCVPISSL